MQRKLAATDQTSDLTDSSMVKTKPKLVPGAASYRPKILFGIFLCVGLVYLYARFGVLGDTPSREVQDLRSKKRDSAEAGSMGLRSIDFEVFGRVQGVFFRKFTQKEAVKLKLVGWCMNTRSGTVTGQAQGAIDAINAMKYWLQNTGSPSSRIDKAVVTNERDITEPQFNTFSVRQ